MIREGLDQLRGLGERFVIVVGHPDYYPRFGFSTAAARVESPFPPDAFMALELMPGVLDGIQGGSDTHARLDCSRASPAGLPSTRSPALPRLLTPGARQITRGQRQGPYCVSSTFEIPVANRCQVAVWATSWSRPASVKR